MIAERRDFIPTPHPPPTTCITSLLYQVVNVHVHLNSESETEVQDGAESYPRAVQRIFPEAKGLGIG